MNYNEAIEYIHSVTWLGSRPGLERIGELCRLMGDPQNNLKFVHVAGTNGKGSFCAMISSVLKEAGYTVGTFTSPYVYSFNERMAVNGEPVKDSELADIVEYVRPFADSMKDSPTEFELITAIGFEFFSRKKCDIVVLEAGLGGRLDSTNVIGSSELSVICSIALDHTDILGDTTEKIAAEKAGIIKRGCPVLVGKADSAASAVIKDVAAKMASECKFADYDSISNTRFSLKGTDFNVAGYDMPIHIGLCGTYQPENALLAINAAEMLGIDEKYIRKGLEKAFWRARFEVISHDPVIIFDGGHNPHGVSAAVRSAGAVLGRKAIVVTGVMADKDYKSMVKMLSEAAERVYCTEPDNPRVLPAEKYARCFCESGVAATAIPDVGAAVKAAVEDAKKTGLPVFILGSLYMYRQVIDACNAE